MSPGEKIVNVEVTEDELKVELLDGRTLTVPLAWYPRLLHAAPDQRANWEIAGAGYGIHWPDIDEDLSSEGLLRGTGCQAIRAVIILRRRDPSPSRFPRTQRTELPPRSFLSGRTMAPVGALPRRPRSISTAWRIAPGPSRRAAGLLPRTRSVLAIHGR